MKNKSIYQLIKEVSLNNPNKIAYSSILNKVNYKTFLNRIDELSLSFKNLGVKKGDYVSIISFETEEVLECIYALNKLGAVSSILNPLYSEEELRQALNLTNSKIVIIYDNIYNKILSIKNDTSIETIIKIESNKTINRFNLIKNKLFYKKENDQDEYINFSKLVTLSKSNEELDDVYNDEAIILYSGSLNNKLRGIILTNNSINNFVNSLNKRLDIGDVKVLNLLPIFTGFGISFSHFIHSNALEKVITDISDLKNVDELIIRSKPNFIFSNPNLINNFINSRKTKYKDLSFIEKIMCTSEIMSEDFVKRVNNYLYEHNSECIVDNMYGCNELTSGVTLTNGDKFGSVGTPLDNVDIKILDTKTNKVLKNNTSGEICISSNTIMKEYLHDKEETNDKIFKIQNKKYYHTGDIGYLDEEGYLFFESKMDDVIVSDGYRIYRKQIEDTIMKHPYVDKCVVIALPHPYKKEVVKAYIVLKKGLVLNSEIKKSIRSFCEKHIASYALPYAYGYRKEIPQNILGKISYNELINDKDEEI